MEVMHLHLQLELHQMVMEQLQQLILVAEAVEPMLKVMVALEVAES
jgi:hypothetical protein